jgi:2-dehydro-3-deoxyphosphogluconate aldolase/(4S)-4-hydroxy-2-oxoglutarate aldolase
LSPEHLDAAAGAGAHFGVAAATNMAVVHASRELEFPFFPGVATASEIERLYALELRILSVFPAGPLGGPEFLRAVSACYPEARFIASGGIGPRSLRDYLAVPSVLAVGGAWLITPGLVRAGSFNQIEFLAREARRAASRPRTERRAPTR